MSRFATLATNYEATPNPFSLVGYDFDLLLSTPQRSRTVNHDSQKQHFALFWISNSTTLFSNKFLIMFLDSTWSFSQMCPDFPRFLLDFHRFSHHLGIGEAEANASAAEAWNCGVASGGAHVFGDQKRHGRCFSMGSWGFSIGFLGFGDENWWDFRMGFLGFTWDLLGYIGIKMRFLGVYWIPHLAAGDFCWILWDLMGSWGNHGTSTYGMNSFRLLMCLCLKIV